MSRESKKNLSIPLLKVRNAFNTLDPTFGVHKILFSIWNTTSTSIILGRLLSNCSIFSFISDEEFSIHRYYGISATMSASGRSSDFVLSPSHTLKGSI